MSSAPRKLFIVGFMASGKSTVGPALAALLDRPFIDLDDLIVARVGCTIGEFIRREGEPRFREIETECLRAAAAGADAVIALGGGAFTQAVNCEIVRESGTSVWLDAPFDLCWRRITSDAIVRPLAPDEVTARERFAARQELYRLAGIHVEISANQTPEEIAEQILKAL
jgi:shikimate kinase